MTIRSRSALGGITATCVLGVALLAGDARAACGDPNGDGRIVAGDALLTLRAAVGQTACALDTCDVDMSGTINTADALKLLRAAAGLPPPLACLVVGIHPNDTLFDEQYGLVAVHAPQAWRTRTDCSNTVVAIVDSGIDYYHDDLDDNLWVNPGEIPHNHKDDDGNGFADDVHGYDFVSNDEYPWDPNSHGTHVGGIIGAEGNNSFGTTGICWEARIMAVRCFNEAGQGFSSDILQCVDYARKNGARVINNSYGGPQYDSGEFYAFNAADDADIVQVVSAGNESDNNDALNRYPANFGNPAQITVAATDEDNELSAFSNFGKLTVHIGAPGTEILSSIPYDDFEFFDGTSMAAPHVAGAATLIRSEFPTLTASEVKRAILNSASFALDLDGLVVTDGILNIEDALAEARDIAFGFASASSQAAAPASPPALRSRRVTRSWTDAAAKYHSLQDVEESFSDGHTRTATMAADHLVVTLDDADAIGGLEKAGFHVTRRLAAGQVTVLVDTPDGTEAAAASLAGIDGVRSVSGDYLYTLD